MSHGSFCVIFHRNTGMVANGYGSVMINIDTLHFRIIARMGCKAYFQVITGFYSFPSHFKSPEIVRRYRILIIGIFVPVFQANGDIIPYGHVPITRFSCISIRQFIHIVECHSRCPDLGTGKSAGHGHAVSQVHFPLISVFKIDESIVSIIIPSPMDCNTF